MTFYILLPHVSNAQDGNEKYLLIGQSGNELLITDLSSGQQRSFLTFESTEPIYIALEMSMNNTVYIILRSSRPLRSPQSPESTNLTSQLLEADLDTKETTVILERDNLQDLILSPDEAHGVLTYFRPRGTTFGMCLLDFTTKTCDDIEVEYVIRRSIAWLDNRSFVFMIGNSIAIYNVDDRASEMVTAFDDWTALSVTPYPKTPATLVVTGIPPTPEHHPAAALFNITDDQVEQLEIKLSASAEFDRVPVTDISLSPDGEYLLYSHAQRYALINLTSGERVTELQNVTPVTWLPDSSGLIAIVSGENETSQSLVRFDLETRTFEVLIQNHEGMFFQDIVPESALN